MTTSEAVASGPLAHTTMWKAETTPPHISALNHKVRPKVDFEQITSLNDFGRSLLQEPDPALRRQQLCDIFTSQTVPGHWAMVIAINTDAPEDKSTILASSPDNLPEKQDVHVSRTAINAALSTSSPVLADNFSNDQDLIDLSIVSEVEEQAVAVCPIEEVDSQAYLLYVNLPPRFASIEWLAVIALALKEYQQAETALQQRAATQERAALDRELENARAIQHSILPNPPEVTSLDAAWSFKPCDSVGGDYLDLVTLPDGKLLFAIADVAGHGLTSALAALSIHSILQTALKSGVSPSKMMAMMNDHVYDYHPPGQFVTMLAVIIDPKTGETQCASAGHHPPIAVAPDGSTRQLNIQKHLILGVDPGITFNFDTGRDHLTPDEALLLYTDGLIEMTKPEGGMLKAEGLTLLLSDCHTQQHTSAQTIKKIRAALDELQGSQPVLDDQTFMLIRRK